MKPKLPLVYACSGASSAAQMANHLAVKLDRRRVAEMSSIAGVGGDVKPLVKTAKSGRPVIALDGRPQHCAAKILKRHGLKADKHLDLSELEEAQARRCWSRGSRARAPANPRRSAIAPTRERKKVSSLYPPAAAAEEIPEPASPPCYLSELSNLKGSPP